MSSSDNWADYLSVQEDPDGPDLVDETFYQVRRLWSRTLLRSIRDWHRYRPPVSGPDQRSDNEKDLFDAADQWYRSDDTYLGSFRYVCEVIQWDYRLTRGRWTSCDLALLTELEDGDEQHPSE